MDSSDRRNGSPVRRECVWYYAQLCFWIPNRSASDIQPDKAMKFVKSKPIIDLLAASLLAGCMSLAAAPAKVPKPAEYRLRPPDKAWVARTLKSLPLRDKIAQLIQVRVQGKFLNRNSPDFVQIRDEVQSNHVGGVVLFAGNVYESAVLLNDLQSLSRLPLVVSADFERGASFRIADTTSFPWTMAIGAAGSEDFAYKEGAVTAQEARALGVHWLFAPVADVNNNPDNPVINIRSYGEDPQLVARLATAFIRGAHDRGTLATAKHFPGHGDTATDTHIGLAVIPSDLARLNSVEFVPFKSAIAAGVDSIMTAHIAVPEVTGEPGLPATLSPRILTGLLRDSLHFKGLIVTDALEMGGITTRFWGGLAAVRAIQAGADMLLLPPDTNVAINEVERAVRRGDISETRINESVERVLAAKSRLGLQLNRTVAISRISELVGSPENQMLAQTMADRSITLVKDEKHLLPIDPRNPPSIFSIVVASDLETSPGAVFQAELRRRFLTARTASVDPRTSDALVTGIVKTASASDVIILSTLVRVISGRGTIALPENQRTLIDQLIATGKPIIWLAFGNPYLLRLYPQVPTYICTFSYSDVSQIAAAKALAGEIPITGRMPVSIPGCSRLGDGLQLPALDMTLKSAQPTELGLPENAFAETKRLLAGFVEDKAFPGASLVVGYKDSIVLDDEEGRLDYSAKSRRVTADTIYDLASVSKAVGTTTAAMMLFQSGRLLLNAPVQDYLPEFKGPQKDKVRVLNLLNHSAGLPPFLQLYKEYKGYQQMLKAVCETPLVYEPGTKTEYSDLGMILLGEIISRAAGRPLNQFLAQHLFEPLAMKSTFYRPPKSLLARIAPTEKDPWRGRIVRGEVHDENAYAMGGVAGHAGLFSSAHDLALFAQMMLNGGIYDHRRYLNPDTIQRFTATQEGKEGARALGWGKPDPSKWTEKVFSPSAFGHTGFTGTLIWIDPQRHMFIILLTNRVYPSRENLKIDEARQVICESVVQAITGGETR